MDHKVKIIRTHYLLLLSTLVIIAWPGVCERDKSAFREHFVICSNLD